MTNFDKSWTRPEKPGVSEKLRDSVKNEGPLKPRMQAGVSKLQAQIAKLDTMMKKMRDRDNRLFQKIVFAMKNHDNQTAKILSSELVELRKSTTMIGHARMTLEQAQLRLTTMHDVGDAMATIGPAMGTMKNLKTSLSKFMPDADAEINSVTQTLNGLMMDSLAGESFGAELDVHTEETERILQEASSVAEQQIGERFPSVPSQIGTQSTSTIE
ncbi:MAG: hypothetical protein F4Y82_05630 [Cenarchaeum sp. SB0665_bin_23]|nr:hypothetical protein [Cenarchaeum sp. SB0667_bin_13]MXY37638.1 hypothetical protein [Cenarchaeum sp. SB0664_bin_35]MXY61572.1 hypothetical protein [Cenarchaeum sp. SB0665_bin_23]MXZ94029.1 hypothetical protein [Cenarchaeum sp. SB0666_bin_15]MYB47536.1 hypothetical protein [Cenarchaeum sp. SB0662_bin_33]MYC79836.1 hypothetical protein [Cenarchaeum sp. SB0661_bin_35]MYD59211.1 hypothetical protein [Cenarchaeum sp. SB0678_bin_8]MYG32534.1 hypothetical protein [Cenarchaeum sp. SB0677_bin_16]